MRIVRLAPLEFAGLDSVFRWVLNFSCVGCVLAFAGLDSFLSCAGWLPCFGLRLSTLFYLLGCSAFWSIFAPFFCFDWLGSVVACLFVFGMVVV